MSVNVSDAENGLLLQGCKIYCFSVLEDALIFCLNLYSFETMLDALEYMAENLKKLL